MHHLLFRSTFHYAHLAANAIQAHAPRPGHASLPHWLTRFGTFGLMAASLIDASVIPLPVPGTTDLMLLWFVAHGGNPWLLVPCTVAASILGGFTTWQMGRKGGEAGLKRYVPARYLRRIVGWVQTHRVLAVFIPAILPPPIPLSPFALAAGALGVSRTSFLAAFGAARALRYSFVAWLAVRYGHRIIRVWSTTLAKWSTPLMWTFIVLTVAGVCFGIWKLRKRR